MGSALISVALTGEAYSEKVIDHTEPRNVGKLDADSDSVGTGMGAPFVWRRYAADPGHRRGVIEDAKFKTYGCGSQLHPPAD